MEMQIQTMHTCSFVVRKYFLVLIVQRQLRLPPNSAAPAAQCHTATYHSLHQPPRATLQRYQGLQSTAPATKCHTGAAPATQRHTATYPSLHQPPRATLQRYQDASITCDQMSHWCCACHTTSHCNVHATYHSLHQPRRPTLQRYQDASIDCACHQMSHWCCATASHCNAPFPAPATQSHAPTLPGCFNHLPPNVTLVLRLPHNVTLQRTCNVPFPAPATQSHAPTLPGCFNRLRLPPNVTLVLRLPHNVTIQRTIPCTSHTDPRCNWKCHVYKRANFTCTSEPISRVQANPRPADLSTSCDSIVCIQM